jgi:hypothetical protein
MSEQSHRPTTEAELLQALDEISAKSEYEETLRLHRITSVGWRALRDIAEHGDSPYGYWHRSRALLALEELDALELHE